MEGKMMGDQKVPGIQGMKIRRSKVPKLQSEDHNRSWKRVK
ncbi:MAG: hypothetical protein WED05_08825 [Candidatus Atabeyarchaeum deiterrae]